jgi:NitT/TauT family transport system substrate-binding protein
MRAAWLAVAQLMVVPLAGCTSGSRERVTLGTSHQPAFALVFIAEAKGYLAANGVTLVQRRFTSGRDALGALAAHEVDAATVFESPIARRAVWDRDLRILTTLHVADRNTCVVARVDRGIRRAEDLAGKRVGSPRNTNTDYFLHVLLTCAGITRRPPEIVDVAPQRAAEALATGTVDAVAIWQPHLARARALLGPERSVEICSDVYTELSLLVTRADVLRGRRGALVKVVRALADAERLVREQPGEAFAALRGEFPELPEDQLRDAWSRVRAQLGITHQLAASLERESEWFRAQGRAAGPPIDLGGTLVSDLLAEVDQEAVTFVSPARAPDAR